MTSSSTTHTEYNTPESVQAVDDSHEQDAPAPAGRRAADASTGESGSERAGGPVYVADAARPRPVFNLPELWQHRELLYLLVSRDIKVRYRQTALGVVWALLGPMLMILVFTFFFGMLGRLGPDEAVPYAAFLVPGLIIWNYFDSSMGRASNSLSSNQNLISKVYFPRAILPLSNITSPLVDLLFGLLVLVGVMIFFGITPTWRIVLSLPYLVLAGVAALGMGLGLSALNAHYRDVKHILPVLTRTWFFCTPIFYHAGLVPEKWHTLWSVNPMVTVVDGVRWAWLPLEGPSLAMHVVSIAAALAMLFGGYLVFQKMERTFSDVL